MILIHSNEYDSFMVATATELVMDEDGYFDFRECKIFARYDGNSFQRDLEAYTVSHDTASEIFQTFYEWGNDGTFL